MDYFCKGIEMLNGSQDILVSRPVKADAWIDWLTALSQKA